MKIIGVKRINPSNERLGYIKALLLDEGAGWIKATRENVPSTGEVFVPRNFSSIKFIENEVFKCDGVEPIGDTDGSCDFRADGSNCSAVDYYFEDVFSVIDIDQTLNEAESLRVSSEIKPTTLCFIRTVEDEQSIIAGP